MTGLEGPCTQKKLEGLIFRQTRQEIQGRPLSIRRVRTSRRQEGAVRQSRHGRIACRTSPGPTDPCLATKASLRSFVGVAVRALAAADDRPGGPLYTGKVGGPDFQAKRSKRLKAGPPAIRRFRTVRREDENRDLQLFPSRESI